MASNDLGGQSFISMTPINFGFYIYFIKWIKASWDFLDQISFFSLEEEEEEEISTEESQNLRVPLQVTTMNNEYPGLEERMHNVILHLFEGGVHNKLFHFYMHKINLTNVHLMEFESNEPKPLELRHILQLLIIFIVCLFLSLILFAFENCIGRCK